MESDDGRLPRGSSPADTLISPRLWKHALVGVACALAWAGMLLLGDAADRTDSGLANIIGLQAGHLARFFSTVMLLAAGQLAFINLWYRSRSRKDFNGSYKVWFYTAVGWLTLCAFTATGSHWNLADAVLAGRPVPVWNGRMVVWLIPGAIVAVSLYRLLLREMRDCRGSLCLLRLSGVAALGCVAGLLLGPFLGSPRTQLLWGTGLSSLWHLLLALSMLLHARHVIHVSNEPPATPIQPWRWKLPSLSLGRWWRRRESGLTSAAKPSGSKSRSAGRTTRARSSGKARRPSRPAAVEDDDEVEADTGDDSEALSDDPTFDATVDREEEVRTSPAARTPPAGPESSAGRRIDPPQSAVRRPHVSPAAAVREPAEDVEEEDVDDDDGEAGLSRKERRRLRKLQRQSASRR